MIFSLNPVPFIYVTNNNSATVKDRRLADVAPSILHIMGLEQPADMTGECLIQDSLSVGNYGFLVMKLPVSRNETLTQLVPVLRSDPDSLVCRMSSPILLHPSYYTPTSL